MKYSAAAGVSANDFDAVGLHEGTVDLRFRVLISANDDGIVVLPQQQIVAVTSVGQYILFIGKVICRIRRAGLEIDHLFHEIHHLCGKNITF